MILYIPTQDAEQLLELLGNRSENGFCEAWFYDIRQQIIEQLPKSTQTISLQNAIEKVLKQHKLIK
jgi:hypothetical protein